MYSRMSCLDRIAATEKDLWVSPETYRCVFRFALLVVYTSKDSSISILDLGERMKRFVDIVKKLNIILADVFILAL